MFWFIFYKARVKHWLTSCTFLQSCPSEPYLTGYIATTLFNFTLSPPLLIFFLLYISHRLLSLAKSPLGDLRRQINSEGIKKERGGFRSVMWCCWFDLCLKFIIKSVSITARRAAGYQGQPNALLMRHSETHIHTQTHTCCSHYVQIGVLQPPCPALA